MLIREAIRGSDQDFTEGSIGRAIFLLSIPMVLEMAMESLFGITNIFWVSRLRDADAVALVGITESLLTIIFAIAMGLSMATTALVARRIGEKDQAGAVRAAVQSILLGAVLQSGPPCNGCKPTSTRRLCPPIASEPDDYCRKPCPPLWVTGIRCRPDDYCRKPTACVPAIKACQPDDYCRKPVPRLLCPLSFPRCVAEPIKR